MKTMSSREFNQDTSSAKRSAAEEPVVITDRGNPTLVLLSYETYMRMSGKHASVHELLTMPDGDDIEFDPPRSSDLGRAADFS